MKKALTFLGFVFLALWSGVAVQAAPVTIFAASSLKTALDQIIVQEQLDAVAVYGGSAALARQISQGAEADIVILAHREWMDWLATQNAIEPASRCNLLGNTLVLAGAAQAAPLDLNFAQDVIDALKGGRLAIGQTRAVPAGQYGAEFLSNMGWLDALRPHFAETSNVRLALALIARGEVALGLVYASDVIAEPRVRSLFTPAPELYSPIRYPMALIAREKNAKDEDAAQNVAKALANASDAFVLNGFTALADDEADRCS